MLLSVVVASRYGAHAEPGRSIGPFPTGRPSSRRVPHAELDGSWHASVLVMDEQRAPGVDRQVLTHGPEQQADEAASATRTDDEEIRVGARLGQPEGGRHPRRSARPRRPRPGSTAAMARSKTACAAARKGSGCVVNITTGFGSWGNSHAPDREHRRFAQAGLVDRPAQRIDRVLGAVETHDDPTHGHDRTTRTGQGAPCTTASPHFRAPHERNPDVRGFRRRRTTPAVRRRIGEVLEPDPSPAGSWIQRVNHRRSGQHEQPRRSPRPPEPGTPR